MSFESEKEFEQHLRERVISPLLADRSDFHLMKSKKAVDILICRNGIKPALFFIEVKYHRNNHGRLGFGQAKGGGFQPELLMKNPDYFNSNMRWIIGLEGEEGYLFLNNDEIIATVNGGKVEEKYNGIRVNELKKLTFLDLGQLQEEISKWIF